MKKIYYWSPFTSKVATVMSVINSMQMFNNYQRDGKYKASIIDAVGEWTPFQEILTKKKIGRITLNSSSSFHKLKINGFFKSRIAYWYIFFKSIFKLNKILINNKPDFLIIHLITSLPILLFLFNNYETKLILRISGLPKLNIIRRLIWQIGCKKIQIITCPTIGTFNELKKINFLKDKLRLLRDPVLNIADIQKIKNSRSDLPQEVFNFIKNSKYFLLVGRFTKQKNFLFFFECLKKVLKNNKNYKFLLIGEGEEQNKFIDLIKINEFGSNVLVHSHTSNVHFLMRNSEAFILTSLWEDPGFVLIESAYNNCNIISSNCPNGPTEILKDDGYIFQSNSVNSFLNIFENFLNDLENIKKQKKINLKKRIKLFSSLNHYLELKKILDE